jgi:serine/threonine-protein kinase
MATKSQHWMNPSTTRLQGTRTISFTGQPDKRCPNDLFERYQRILDNQYMGWTEHLRFRRLLGTGGQGMVYLSDRRGSDGFTLPVALKVFSPVRYCTQQDYDRAMERMAQVASRVAKLQHDSLLDVQNFTERHCIRIMEMEWVDGYDLDQLLTPSMLARAEQCHSHHGPSASAAATRHCRGDHPSMLSCVSGPASRGDCSR